MQFMHTLAETSNNGEVHLKMGEVSAKASHQGENRDGRKATYSLELSDESDGTRKLMALAYSYLPRVCAAYWRHLTGG